ncbi:MAG: transcriptional regulator [Sphingomonadales bacterium]|nr:transcriptional regulator [Sphingomonadales bacterium]
MAEDRRKIEYRLTDKGAALLPAVVSLRQWGEKWESCVPSTPVLVDRMNQQPIREIMIYSQDGRELELRDLSWAHAEDVRPADYLRMARAA